jgi:hypothetical protein
MPVLRGDLGVSARQGHIGYLEGNKEKEADLGYGMQ